LVSKTQRRKWKLDARTFDEYSRDLQRQRDREMMENFMRLWRQGDFSFEQGKLTDTEEKRAKRRTRE